MAMSSRLRSPAEPRTSSTLPNPVLRTAASFGFVGGYDVTYDQTTGDDYVEVFLAQFTTAAHASAFEQVLLTARSGAARSTFAAIPGAVALDDTQPESDGTYEHDIAALKGTRLMGVSYTTTNSGPVNQLSSIALTDYRRL